MGFGKDEAGGEEAPAFGDQALPDGQCLHMVGIIIVQQGKECGRINQRAPCRGSAAGPHACL